MTSTPPPVGIADSIVASAAAAAIIEVHEEIHGLARHAGRAGVVARLRERAAELVCSGAAREQLKSRALEVAADDLAWGRAALSNWPTFFAEELRPSSESRAELRRLVTPYQPADAVAASVAASIEARLLHDGGDSFTAARHLADRLGDEIVLQAALWDDPRIAADLDARRLMRAGELGLSLRLEAIKSRKAERAKSQLKRGGVWKWLRAPFEPWASRA